MEHLGEKIKDLRKASRIEQRTLSEKTGIPQSTVSYYEKQAEPPLDFIRKALSVLSPDTKLFEFLADPEDLNDYIPSWIMTEDIEMLRALYDLDPEMRMKIRRLWTESLVTVLEALRRGK